MSQHLGSLVLPDMRFHVAWWRRSYVICIVMPVWCKGTVFVNDASDAAKFTALVYSTLNGALTNHYKNVRLHVDEEGYFSGNNVFINWMKKSNHQCLNKLEVCISDEKVVVCYTLTILCRPKGLRKGKENNNKHGWQALCIWTNSVYWRTLRKSSIIYTSIAMCPKVSCWH